MLPVLQIRVAMVLPDMSRPDEKAPFFLNSAGNAVKDIYKYYHEMFPGAGTARTYRTSTATARTLLDPSQADNLTLALDHSRPTEDKRYRLNNSSQTISQLKAVQAAGFMAKLENEVLPNVLEFFPPDSSFEIPEDLDIDAQLREFLGLDYTSDFVISEGFMHRLKANWRTAVGPQFINAMAAKLLNLKSAEPKDLSLDSSNTWRKFWRQMTTAILQELHRLKVP